MSFLMILDKFDEHFEDYSICVHLDFWIIICFLYTGIILFYFCFTIKFGHFKTYAYLTLPI